MTTPTKRPTSIGRLLLMLVFVVIASAVQAISIKVAPAAYYCTQTASNKLRFDVYVKNVGADEIGYRAHTLRFTMNRAIIPTAGALPAGSTVWVAGTGDPRLAALQVTYNGASSFTVSATTAQVNLGGGGTIYDQNTSPRIAAGDSIWLGTFEVTAPAGNDWTPGTSSNPAWVIGSPCSVTVYDLPPSTGTATICNSTGTGTTISSGQLQNGQISANNPTGLGQAPCSLLLNGCSFAGAPAVVDASCGATPTGSISVTVANTSGNITYTLNPGAVVIGPTASTTATFNGLLPGVYSVTYSDGVGCGQTASNITINPGSGPTDDLNACTIDACNPDGSTSHTPIPGIDDFNACTQDACNPADATITHTPNPLINDGNACTVDACDIGSGVITHTANADIDDGNACTTDFCYSVTGYTSHNANADIDDGNPCTVDACNPATGIASHTAVVPEDDGNACTDDVCVTTSTPDLISSFYFDDPGYAAAGWVRFNLNGTVQQGFSSGLWLRFNLGCTADPTGGSSSQTTTGATLDTWEVSGAILVGNNAKVTWGGFNFDSLYRDGYEVRLFTVPPTPASAPGSTLLYTVAAETWTPFCDDFTTHSVSLAAYAGQTVFIGFRNHTPFINSGLGAISVAVFVDNFEVYNDNTGGTTVHIPKTPTDDGNACTTDVCNSLTGATEHIAVTPDDDGNACTADVCNSTTGLTEHFDLTVNDGNACTADVCNPATGITAHNDLTENDGNACTADVCNPATGVTAHNDITENDNNACTQDVCNPATGITAHNDLTQDDGNACTADVCNPATGVTAHNDLTVNDNNACTQDVCNPATGITAHNDLTQDDGNACTADVCNPATGITAHNAIPPVSDGIACTNDVCNPATGLTEYFPYTVSASATPGTIACFGGNTCVSVTSSGGIGTVTYSDGATSNGSGSFCGVTAGGPYTYTATDANGCSAASNPVVISQPDKLNIDSVVTTPSGCVSNDGSITVYASGGTPPYSYSLTPGGPVSNPALNLGGGNYIVTVKDANNCSQATTANVGSSGSSLPAPSPISGAAGACRKQTGAVYSVPAVAGALSYHWSVPANATITSGQGTTSITVSFNNSYAGGFICVSDSNACGTSPVNCKNVPLITTKPAKPTISGSSIVCRPSVVTFCATSLRATSYSWSVDHGMVILSGTGTSCITVQIPATYDGGGHVKVKGVNCKGMGDEKSLDLKLSKPAAPTITGPSPACRGSVATYCASSASATGYNWTVDHGMVILSGTGTSCITVQIPADYDGAGHVKASGVNCNGIGDVKSFDVKKTNPIVSAPVFCIQDNNDNQTTGICGGSTHEYEICMAGNVGDYVCLTWTGPAGSLIDGHLSPYTQCRNISAGDGNDVDIRFPFGFTSGTVTVSASNACGSTASASLAVSSTGCNARMDSNDGVSELSAYPNPTSGKVSISFTASTTEKYTLKVSDLLGNVLVSQVNTSHEGANLREVDLSGLAKGMYLISIERDAAQTQTMRIVVE